MCREQEKGHSKSACFQELLQCPKQCGKDWAQMGHRRVDPMGTPCPLHPISSLSHGGFSPGRERRHEEEERQDLCFLVQKKPPRAYVCTHSRCTYTHKHTPCPPVGNGLDLPTIEERTSGHMCIWGRGRWKVSKRGSSQCDREWNKPTVSSVEQVTTDSKLQNKQYTVYALHSKLQL